jgi:membrane protein DedA with SNARE-associated domain
MPDLHSLLNNFSYIAIFLLMTTNGIMNLPPSQFLYPIAGYLVSTNVLLFAPTVIAGALGNTLGNIITYLLVKKYDKPFARKLLMVDEVTFNKIHTALHRTFARRGMWYIFIGKLTPSVKAFVPAVAGLASTEFRLTSFLFLIASFIWATGLVALGYFFGEHASISSLTIVSFLIAFIVIGLIYRSMKKELTKKP